VINHALLDEELWRKKLEAAGYKVVLFPWPSITLEPAPVGAPPPISRAILEALPTVRP
jgi:hypothetical protein